MTKECDRTNHGLLGTLLGTDPVSNIFKSSIWVPLEIWGELRRSGQWNCSFIMSGVNSEFARWLWNITNLVSDVLNIINQIPPLELLDLEQKWDQLLGSDHLAFWWTYIKLRLSKCCFLMSYYNQHLMRSKRRSKEFLVMTDINIVWNIFDEYDFSAKFNVFIINFL